MYAGARPKLRSEPDLRPAPVSPSASLRPYPGGIHPLLQFAGDPVPRPPPCGPTPFRQLPPLTSLFMPVLFLNITNQASHAP